MRVAAAWPGRERTEQCKRRPLLVEPRHPAPRTKVNSGTMHCIDCTLNIGIVTIVMLKLCIGPNGIVTIDRWASVLFYNKEVRSDQVPEQRQRARVWNRLECLVRTRICRAAGSSRPCSRYPRSRTCLSCLSCLVSPAPQTKVRDWGVIVVGVWR